MTTLNLDVLWRDRGATRGLKGIGDETDKAARHMQRFKVAAGVAAVAVGAAVLKFGKDSVKAYAEAQTSQARLQDAFQKFPRLADTNIGALRNLNTELAKKTRFDDDATASGQAVLAQFKLTGQQITQLTPLLQDYAAKTGRDLPQAASLLGKAMLGNGRALKEVGINFKDTGDQGKNFDQIMSGLRTQVGGFAEKEGKTAAGQVEILKNRFGELQEAAGSHLLPTITKIVGGVTDMAVAFGELGPFAKGVITTFAVGIPTLTLAALGIGKVMSAAQGAKAALAGMGIAAKTATIATAGIGAALGVAALAFGYYAEQNAKAKQQTDDFTEALIASNGAIDDNIRNMAAKALQDKDAFDNAAKLGISLQDVTDAALGNDAAMQRVMTAVDHYASAVDVADTKTQDQVDAANELADALLPLRKRFDDGKTAAGQFGTATQGASTHTETLEEKSKAAHAELGRLRTAMFRAASAALQLQGSEDGVEAAIDDATASIKENGRTLDRNTEKGRNNRQALRNIASASNQYRQALIDQKAPQDKINRATDQAREAFIKAARRMGSTREEAQKLADKFGLTRRKTDEAAEATRKYDRAINALNSKRINLVANYRATATAATAKFLENVPAAQRSGFSQLPRGGPTKARSLDSMIGGPASAPNMEQGGPTMGSSSLKVSTPGLDRARRMGQAWDDVALAAYRPNAKAGLRYIGKAGQDYLTGLLAASSMGAPGGSVGTYSAGMAATIARLRAAGARSFTTYPGHHPSAAKARDVTPHNWRIANTARASSGVWYVIYQMRIASKNHGNTWRQYNPTNHNGDWQHRRHVHVAWFDKAGLLKPGLTLAYNGTGRNERVLTPAQTQAYDKGGGNTYIINAPNYVGSQADLAKAVLKLAERGQLTRAVHLAAGR